MATREQSRYTGRMDDFTKTMQDAGKSMTEEEQKSIAKAQAGTMQEDHKEWIAKVIALVDAGEIDLFAPKSLLNQDVYDGLDQEWKEKADLALINITTLLKKIVEFWKSTDTPDESPQLDTMVAELWQMKERIEKD